MTARHRAARLLLAAACFLACPAYPTSFSTDQSDLYYVAAESGWGIQLVQRGPVIFATIFVYGASNAPTWYIATMRPGANGTWTGDLLATTGPYFGTVPFNPANVAGTKVGTMTWTPTSVTAGTLTYDVNGVAVTKNVVRQTLVFDDFSGHYAGLLHFTVTGCADPMRNVTADLTAVQDIVHSGTTINIVFSGLGGACAFGGTYSQAGQFGAISGTYTCNGDTGTVQVSEMQVTPIVVSGRIALVSSTSPGCRSTGWFGGVHVTTF